MRNFISFCTISLLIASTGLATTDFDPISECIWDKYYTKAEALKIKIEELNQKEQSESSANKKSTIRTEKEKSLTKLKSLREKKRAFDVLKKETFFEAEEGLKMTFPAEFEACSEE